jgi:hypothetical protein
MDEIASVGFAQYTALSKFNNDHLKFNDDLGGHKEDWGL